MVRPCDLCPARAERGAAEVAGRQEVPQRRTIPPAEGAAARRVRGAVPPFVPTHLGFAGSSHTRDLKTQV